MKKIIAVMAVLIKLFFIGYVLGSAGGKGGGPVCYKVGKESSRWGEYIITHPTAYAGIQ